MENMFKMVFDEDIMFILWKVWNVVLDIFKEYLFFVLYDNKIVGK